MTDAEIEFLFELANRAPKTAGEVLALRALADKVNAELKAQRDAAKVEEKPQ